MIKIIETGLGVPFSYVLWACLLCAIILVIAYFEQRIVKKRNAAVMAFLQEQSSVLEIRPLLGRRPNDIIIPVFSGFFIHGHFEYICLDPLNDREKVLSFIEQLKRVCFANNSWHFDFFLNRFYMWRYSSKAVAAFSPVSK